MHIFYMLAGPGKQQVRFADLTLIGVYTQIMDFIPDALEKARAWVNNKDFEKAGRLLVEITGHPGLSDGRSRAEAMALLARCRLHAYEYSAADQALGEAVAEFDRLGDEERRDACRLLTAGLLVREKSLAAARVIAADCLERAWDRSWPGNTARAMELLGKVELREQAYPQALDHLERAALMLADDGLREEAWDLALPRARALIGLGRLGEAQRVFGELVHYLVRHNDPPVYVRKLLAMAFTTWLDGDLELFTIFSDTLVADSDHHGRPLPLACGYCNLGLAALNSGDYKSAHHQLIQSWRIVSKVYENRLQVNSLAGLAVTAVQLNQPVEGLGYIRLARDHLRRGAGLTGRLLPYYSAVVHLAANQAGTARLEWNRKPGLNLTGPVFYHRQWLVDLLRHVQSRYYWTRWPLDDDALHLAGLWQEQLEAWH